MTASPGWPGLLTAGEWPVPWFDHPDTQRSPLFPSFSLSAGARTILLSTSAIARSVFVQGLMTTANIE
jgi:hypothetical protein